MNSNDILHSELFDNGVLRLTLNDQKRRNALSEAMLAKLAHVLSEAVTNADVRVIVLAG